VDVQPDTVARERIIAHEADASFKGIELSVARAAYVTIRATPACVRIMLDNLVDNAINTKRQAVEQISSPVRHGRRCCCSCEITGVARDMQVGA
jgi:hypothetical protein